MEPSGRWRSAPRTAKYRVICKGQFTWRDEESIHDYRGELMNCSTQWDHSWHQYKEYCIHATDHERTWTEAQNHCQVRFDRNLLTKDHKMSNGKYPFDIRKFTKNVQKYSKLSKNIIKNILKISKKWPKMSMNYISDRIFHSCKSCFNSRRRNERLYFQDSLQKTKLLAFFFH